MENKFLNFNGWGEIIGVIFAGLIVLAGIGVGGFLIYAGKAIGGFTSMLTPLGLVGAAFIRARKKQAQEKSAKQ